MMDKPKRVCVVVLGDVGRSPRMQYHALSLAASGFDVDIIGYGGSKPHDAILESTNINIRYMGEVPNFQKYLPRFLSYFTKVLWQSFVLFWALLCVGFPHFILVQNPPSIPLLPVVWIYSRLTWATFVVDWHNYGFTILGLAVGPQSLLVRICRRCEGFFGARGDVHFCVTKALKADLEQRWGISAVVLYDRPAAVFKPISEDEKQLLFQKLSDAYPVFNDLIDLDDFESHRDAEVEPYHSGKPALIVSSTSWTEDEDFSVLLDALQQYDDAAKDNATLPKLIVAITGKGPLKEHYEKLIASQPLERVQFVLPWLEPEDYPKLLAAANIGVSLHTSSSSLDLPMKVVDMFGCCLPVCAINYNCLSELVAHNKNGLHFHSSDELSQQLQTLLSEKGNHSRLREFRANLESQFATLRWEESWAQTAWPLFQQ